MNKVWIEIGDGVDILKKHKGTIQRMKLTRDEAWALHELIRDTLGSRLTSDGQPDNLYMIEKVPQSIKNF